MMRALAAKELRATWRNRAFRVALVGYLAALLTASLTFLAGFLASDDSQFAATNALLFSRLVGFQWVVLAAMTPWLVLQLHGRELGDASLLSITGLMAPPWQVLFVKAAASALCALLLLSLSVPLLTLVWRMGVADGSQIAWSFLDTLLFLLVLIVLTLQVRLMCRSWVASWLGSYLALGVLGLSWREMASLLDHRSVTMIVGLLVLLCGTALLAFADRSMAYERD